MSECWLVFDSGVSSFVPPQPDPHFRPRPRNLARLIKMTPSAQSILRVPSCFPLIAPYPARPRFGRLSLDAFVLSGILAERRGRLVCGPQPLVFGPCPCPGFPFRLRIIHRPGGLPFRRFAEKVWTPASIERYEVRGGNMPERGAFGRGARLVLPTGGVSGQGGNGFLHPLRGVSVFRGSVERGRGWVRDTSAF